MNNKIFNITFAVFVLTAITFISCKRNKPNSSDNPNTTVYKDDGNGNITVTDKGEGTGTYTFKTDKTYILDGLVFVNDGQVLTIEPGTLIKGKAGQGESASALIIARGGKINAEGTASKPIIFTAEADNREGTGVDADAQGLWGGLIILGRATTNNLTTDKAIEGIPTSETRGLYGGNDDADNSGVLKYVSIRHGGTDIGEGNEINGLTLGAVGSGTVIDYVEIVANKDDGIEFFGGAVTVKHVVVAKCGDDAYDYDEGFHGKGQFWLAIQGKDADRGGEHDGGPGDNETGTPYAKPEIYNATYISLKGDGNKTFTLRDNAGVTYANSIFVNFDKGVDIEYLEDDAHNMVACSYKMFEEGNVRIQNNVFYDVAGQTDENAYDAANLFKVNVPDGVTIPAEKLSAWNLAFAGNNNIVVNPGVNAENPVPSNPQMSNLASYPAGLDAVPYKGAFENSNWAAGWTLTFKN